MNCVACGSGQIFIGYTQPLTYRCESCGTYMKDENDPGIEELTLEQAQARRPSLYDLPSCEKCSHRQHEGDCARCSACVERTEKARRIVKLILAPR